MMKEKKKKEKRKFVDDGRTVANMNVEGFHWYKPERPMQTPLDQSKNEPKLTRKEIFAIIRAAYATLLPYLCGLVVVMILIFLIMWLWLS